MFGITIGRKAKEIRPDDLEVLFHTEAAYHGEHGRLLVTNRTIGMIEKPVIFCLKGVSTPMPMNLRLFWHIWESAKAEGFIPLELLSYGTTIEFAQEPAQGRQVLHMDLAGSSVAQAAEAVEGAVAGSRLRSVAGNGFAAAEVPAYLRKQQEERGADGVGHQSAGFVAATTQTK